MNVFSIALLVVVAFVLLYYMALVIISKNQFNKNQVRTSRKRDFMVWLIIPTLVITAGITGRMESAAEEQQKRESVFSAVVESLMLYNLSSAMLSQIVKDALAQQAEYGYSFLGNIQTKKQSKVALKNIVTNSWKQLVTMNRAQRMQHA